MILPPLPEDSRLWVEESPEEVRIQWPVPGGPAKRRWMVGGAALSCLGAPLLLLTMPIWTGRPLLLPRHWVLYLDFLLMGLGVAWFLLTWLLPISQATGDGLLLLQGDRLLLHRGGGKQPLQARRGDLERSGPERDSGIRIRFGKSLSARRRLFFLSGIGGYFLLSGMVVRLPGPREAVWVREVLERWRAGG